MIAYLAIVRHVGVGHDEAFASEDGFTQGFGAPVDGGAFANRAAIPQNNLRLFALKFQILGNAADHSAVEYAAIFT